MLFNSYTFLIFFAVVLSLHNLPFSWRLKKFNLLWASYLFYAAWNPPFVLLLWISTLTDWFVAKRIYISSTRKRRLTWLVASLTVNLGFLIFFKYSNFLLQTFQDGLALLGITYVPPVFDIILPVGISFYTFQTLSYTLDIYKDKMKPWNSMLDFALFVTFFPQLVAGPIVRARYFLPQCRKWLKPDSRQLGWGLTMMLVGLFQKSVLADGIFAGYVEQVYDSALYPDVATAWAGTLAFAGQIFCDFAGYSTIAIGAAMCLGFKLPDNFRFPYAAVGFSDFWRRWHISLSTWLKDYVYISFGGNRKGQYRTYVNLMLTMMVGGLWHGASWSFVVWGALHGTYLVLERAAKRWIPHYQVWSLPASQFVFGLLTFSLVCIAWVFFRETDITRALKIVSIMFGSDNRGFSMGQGHQVLIAMVMSALLFVHFLLRNNTFEHAAGRIPSWLKIVIMAAMMLSIIMTPGEDRAFIYFQF